MRDARLDPERAQPGGFQTRIILPCDHLFVHHPRTEQTEGQSPGGPRAQLPLSLGNIIAFQCQSHFKLISLCIMFFKSFLNKTKIQSVISLECGRNRFCEWPKKLLGGEKQGTLGCPGAAPFVSSASPAIHTSSLSRRPSGIGSQKYSLTTPHWVQLEEQPPLVQEGLLCSHGPSCNDQNKSRSRVLSNKGQVRSVALGSHQEPPPGSGSQ